MKLKLLTKLAPLGLKLKAASPEILIGVGVVGIIGGTVYACYKTTKLKDIVEEDKETRNELKTSYEEIKTSEDVDLEEAEKAYRKDLTHSYISTAGKVVKLYAGPVIVCTISISCLLYSHVILRRRILGLAAAYTTINESYKKYRQNVVDRYGEDIDRELRFGSTKMKLKDVDPDAITEDNKKNKVDVIEENPQTNKTSDICGYSDYARFFEDGCNGWEKSAEWNLAFLKGVQAKFNDILHTRGYVFLNEIYDWLGIPMSEAGQVVGWLDPKIYPECEGDGVIDFGIYDIYKQKSIDFVNGYERTLLMDFNVDGYIYDKVWHKSH